MNARQLLDKVLPILTSIRDDKDKLTKLLDFMDDEILPYKINEQNEYENVQQLLNQILPLLSSIMDDKGKLAKLLDFMEKGYILPEEDEDDMKTKLPKKYKKIVRRIADSLGGNFICFFNPDTLEVEDKPKELFDEGYYDDESEEDDDELEEGEEEKENESVLTFMKWEKCVKIEPLDSSKSFKIMEDFVDQLSNGKEAGKLSQALNGRKPFAGFNHLIHNSKYREDWFAFRQKELEKHVIRRYFHEYLGK